MRLTLPEGADQFDAAVFNQDGIFALCGHREECELHAAEINGLYCLIVYGRAVIRKDFEITN